jgi:hypothetical protein
MGWISLRGRRCSTQDRHGRASSGGGVLTHSTAGIGRSKYICSVSPLAAAGTIGL